ncbi:MAG: DMT family transporter [Parvibaculaceae bacterium]
MTSNAPALARHPSHSLGVVLVLASAVMFSLAGVLTKMVPSDSWTIVCWRGLFGAPVIAAYVVWRDGTSLGEGVASLGWRGWALATLGSACSLVFIAAFKLTYVANVTLIYATVPFLAAGLGWLMMGERVHRATLAAAGAAIAGVGIMAWGGIGSGGILGDVLALLMSMGLALYMVLIRLFKDTPAVLAAAVSSVQVFLLGWVVTDPLQVSAEDLMVLAAFGVTFAASIILLTEGTRLVPAAEAGLFGTAEIPFAILIAWLVLSELPPTASFIGGTIVLVAVVAHAALDFARGAARGG